MSKLFNKDLEFIKRTFGFENTHNNGTYTDNQFDDIFINTLGYRIKTPEFNNPKRRNQTQSAVFDQFVNNKKDEDLIKIIEAFLSDYKTKFSNNNKETNEYWDIKRIERIIDNLKFEELPYYDEKQNIQSSDVFKLWYDNNELASGKKIKIFISHRNDDISKDKLTEITNNIQKQIPYVSFFLDFKNIEEDSEWEKEVNKAIFSADAFVSLLTPTFHISNWCDQEIGIALGRHLIMKTINLGQGPYGFLSKKQSNLKTIDNLEVELKNWINEAVFNKLKNRYYISKLNNAESFDSFRNALAETFNLILSEEDLVEIAFAANTNDQCTSDSIPKIESLFRNLNYTNYQLKNNFIICN